MGEKEREIKKREEEKIKKNARKRESLSTNEKRILIGRRDATR